MQSRARHGATRRQGQQEALRHEPPVRPRLPDASRGHGTRTRATEVLGNGGCGCCRFSPAVGPASGRWPVHPRRTLHARGLGRTCSLLRSRQLPPQSTLRKREGARAGREPRLTLKGDPLRVLALLGIHTCRQVAGDNPPERGSDPVSPAKPPAPGASRASPPPAALPSVPSSPPRAAWPSPRPFLPPRAFPDATASLWHSLGPGSFWSPLPSA